MKRSELFLMVLQVPFDFFLLAMAGITAYGLRFMPWAVSLRPVLFGLTLAEYLNIVVIVSCVWLIIFALSGVYRIDQNRKLLQELRAVVGACFLGLAAVAIYITFTQEIFDSRFLVGVSWLFAVVYLSLGRLLMRGVRSLLYRAGIGARRVVIVGNEKIASEIMQVIKDRPELGYVVVGELARFPSRNLEAILVLEPDEILFTNPRADEKETLRAIDFCNIHHIVFKYSADLFETYSTNMVVHPLAGIPIVELKRTPLEGWGRITKRLFDIVVSICIIILVSPIMVLVSFVILVETGFPVIYKNERVGLRGRHFFTLKFRSMYQKDSTGAQFGSSGAAALRREKELVKKHNTRQGPIYKIANDPRVTPFGRWIRRWSLDELPQFFNVLDGSMSIVGPRPHQPREVLQYENRHRTILTMKPGITGLAQISGRSDLSYEDEMRLDVYYMEHWTLLTDLVIFVKTPFIVFRKRGVV